jgi:hypothetical protein
MSQLELQLRELGEGIAFPPTPDLVSRVRERVGPEPPARRLNRRLLPVALAAIAVGVAFAVPPARTAILRFFHLGSVSVERVETLPAAEERPLAAGLGSAMSRAEAERRAGFAIVLPEGAEPKRFYARPGLIATFLGRTLLAEMRGDQFALAKKFVGGQTTIDFTLLDGQSALWIAGSPHVLMYVDDQGIPRELRTRLAGNVFIWVHGDRTFRLEGPLSEQKAIALAREIVKGR